MRVKLYATGDAEQTEETPRHCRVGIKSDRHLDVADSQKVQLPQPSAAGAVDGKENRPSRDGASKTYYGEHPEEAQEEEAVNRAIVEDVLVVDGEEGLNPVEPAVRELGRRVPAL